MCCDVCDAQTNLSSSRAQSIEWGLFACSKRNIVVLNKLINVTLMSNEDSKTNYGHGKPADCLCCQQTEKCT